MKITKKKSSKRKLAVLSAIGALVVAAVAVYALWQNNTLSNREMTKNIDETSSVQEQQTDGLNDSSEEDSNPGLPQKPPQQDSGSSDEPGDSPSGVTPEKPNITRAEQSSNTIKVVAFLQQASSGKCELRLSKSGQSTISRTTSIVTGPSYYVCSFNVPRSDLPGSGQWNAVVVHRIGSASTNSTTETIQVN